MGKVWRASSWARHHRQCFGTADEIAAAVASLASPDAAFVTGTALKVDGGICA